MEYKVMHWRAITNSTPLGTFINRAVEGGWRVVSMTQFQNNYTILLERDPVDMNC